MTFLAGFPRAAEGVQAVRSVYFHGGLRLEPGIRAPVTVLAGVLGREVELGCVE